MADLSNLLVPRRYPEGFPLVRESFARQPDGQTCGAAAVRHGLLLGGLSAPVNLLESLLEIRDNQGMDSPILFEGLRSLGFEARPVKKPRKQRTAAFLDDVRPQLEQGAFLLPCLYDGGTGHWVCLGAWDGERAWVVDSFYGAWVPRGMTPSLGFFAYTEQMFDKQDWGDDIVVVSPGKWANQYEAWLPARPALLRMRLKDAPATPASMEAAVAIAAQQYLNNADEYSYRELGLYLPGSVGVTVKVGDPGEDAVLVGEDGVGEGRVLVVRRASGALTRQTPPELVVRAGHLRAVQLN